MKGLCWAMVLLGAAAPALAAQTCFRGRPQPACRAFWLTEAVMGVALTGRTPLGDDVHLGAEVGYMRAVGTRSAVGVGIAAGYDEDALLSLRPRYRRWLGSTWALDLNPGIRWTPGRIETIEARVAVSWRDLLGAWSEVDLDLGGGSRTRWLAGVRSGGQAGIVTYIIGAIVGSIYVAALPRD